MKYCPYSLNTLTILYAIFVFVLYIDYCFACNQTIYYATLLYLINFFNFILGMVKTPLLRKIGIRM